MELLLAMAELRIAAHRWGIDSIRLENRYVVFGYTAARLIRQLSKSSGDRLRVVDERAAYLPLKEGVAQPQQIFGRVKSLLQSG